MQKDAIILLINDFCEILVLSYKIFFRSRGTAVIIVGFTIFIKFSEHLKTSSTK